MIPEGTQKTIPAKVRFWTNPFTVLLGATTLFITSQIVGALLLTPLDLFSPDQNQQLLLYSGGSLLALLGFLLIGAQIIGFSRQKIGVVWPPFLRIVEVVPVFLVYIAISMVLSALATNLIPGFDIDQVQEIGFKNTQGMGQLVMAGAGLVILTPIYEELLFRGILFRGLRTRLPLWLSAGVASLVFALAHGQWNVAVDTFALGLALSFLVERSQSIVPAILLHMLKNGVAFTLLFIVGS